MKLGCYVFNVMTGKYVANSVRRCCRLLESRYITLIRFTCLYDMLCVLYKHNASREPVKSQQYVSVRVVSYLCPFCPHPETISSSANS